MSNNSTFTIVSSGAPLVEVEGQGPAIDLPGGLGVPDGVPTMAPVDLLNAPTRVWRVNAPSSVPATVAITDTPWSLGAVVQVRRCVSPLRVRAWWWRLFAVERWPRLRAALRDRAPSLVALWHLYADDTEPCDWQNVVDGSAMKVSARGGDLVVVNFATP